MKLNLQLKHWATIEDRCKTNYFLISKKSSVFCVFLLVFIRIYFAMVLIFKGSLIPNSDLLTILLYFQYLLIRRCSYKLYRVRERMKIEYCLFDIEYLRELLIIPFFTYLSLLLALCCL